MGVDREYEMALQRTNVTGLGTYDDYVLAFSGIARDRWELMCALAPLSWALLAARILVPFADFVGGFPPGRELPKAMRLHLEGLEEVVTASGTQVLEMRESDGERAADFTVAARQDAATAYIAVGDRHGTRVRDASWTQLPDGNWTLSTRSRELSKLHGWSRGAYEAFRAQSGELLPDPASEAVQRLTAGRPEERDDYLDPPWITFAETVALIRENAEK